MMMDSSLDFAPVWLTLKVASLATISVLIVGIALAFLFARKQFIGKDWLDAILALPLVMPPTVLGYYLIVVFGRNGWLGHWLEAQFGVTLVFTWQGAVIAAAIASFPLLFKSARAAVEGVDLNLENAARSLGAGDLEVFFRVTLPLAVRGILAGTMLTFARAMGEFGATLMIAGDIPGRTQTLSMAVYDAVQAGQDDRANLLVGIISIICVTLLVLSSRLLRPRF